MPANDNKEATKLSPTEIYDLYAPAVYGKILSIVHKGPVANFVLANVFIKSFNDKTAVSDDLKTPLINLLNASREKSYKTLKALNILHECCGGATVLKDEKNSIPVNSKF